VAVSHSAKRHGPDHRGRLASASLFLTGAAILTRQVFAPAEAMYFAPCCHERALSSPRSLLRLVGRIWRCDKGRRPGGG
jgi:hypothetical protein